jgi:hypothetical protein
MPTPLNWKVNCCWAEPTPFGNTWALIVPDGAPALVICMNNVRCVEALGKPLGVPFNTYQAPPVLLLIKTFVPLNGDEALNLPNQGCALLSTVLTAT